MQYLIIFLKAFLKGWCIASGVGMFFFVTRDLHYRIVMAIKNRHDVRRLIEEAKKLTKD